MAPREQLSKGFQTMNGWAAATLRCQERGAVLSTQNSVNRSQSTSPLPPSILPWPSGLKFNVFHASRLLCSSWCCCNLQLPLSSFYLP